MSRPQPLSVIATEVTGWIRGRPVWTHALPKREASPLYIGFSLLTRISLHPRIPPVQHNIVEVFGFRYICFGMKCTELIIATCLVIVLADVVSASYVGPYFEEGEYSLWIFRMILCFKFFHKSIRFL